MTKKGDVVLVSFPFTDLNGVKIRPAVVVSQKNNKQDIVLAFISSQKKFARNSNSVAVKATNGNGLKVDSIIRLDKVATIEQSLVLGTIGRLENSTVKNCNQKLKAVFGLA